MAACSKAKKCDSEATIGDRRGQAEICSSTCGLPEDFEVTKENARAILDMFREKNGGSLTFKLDDTKVRVYVALSGSLGSPRLKRKRAAATPAPSSPKDDGCCLSTRRRCRRLSVMCCRRERYLAWRRWTARARA